MTEPRHGAALAAAPLLSPMRAAGPRLLPGLAGLVLGAALSGGAIAWSQGVLGFLGLVLVLGSLGWISLAGMRRMAARFGRP
jgi:hypothetical protein